MRANQETFIFVHVRGSSFVYSVITPTYYRLLQKERKRAPAGVYEDSEYAEYSCPFTFSTLTESLPFKMTPLGCFRLKAQELPPRDQKLLRFHLRCLKILKNFDLDVGRLWFDYMDDGQDYSSEFKKAYEDLF